MRLSLVDDAMMGNLTDQYLYHSRNLIRTTSVATVLYKHCYGLVHEAFITLGRSRGTQHSCVKDDNDNFWLHFNAMSL
jgi:hypothetical protein